MIEAAFALQRENRNQDAQEIYEHILGLVDQPDPNVLYQYGTLLAEGGYHGIAAQLFRTAIQSGLDWAPVWCNLGYALKHFGRDSASLACYEAGYEKDQKSSVALNGLAAHYINNGTPEKAEEYARQGLEIAPEDPRLHTHLALALLEQERFDEAWPHYAYRWEIPDHVGKKRPYKARRWDGGPVNRLAIHGEQGVGDEILFCSRLNEAAKRAKHIAVECMDRLIPIFQRTWPEISFYPDHATLIAAEGEPDAYCAMGDLFSLCGLPGGESYLAKPPYGLPRGHLRVGVAWRGGTSKTNERERKSALKHWGPILKTPGLEFVSVQYGRDNSEEEAAQAGLKQEVTSRDVDECARAIAGCDLIITVCQTAVHLAGAMGVPCWVLVPKKCAWRYAGTDTRCRWYDSVTFYRQDADEKWQPVIEGIASDIRLFRG